MSVARDVGGAAAIAALSVLTTLLASGYISVSIRVIRNDGSEPNLGAAIEGGEQDKLSGGSSPFDAVGSDLLKIRGPSEKVCNRAPIFGQADSAQVTIVQVGVPRSGSTFQFTLLCAITRLRCGKV